MPHFQFEINKTVKKKLKKDFIVFIEKSFSKIMQTGKDHIAITIRELEKEGRIEGSNHIPRGMLEFLLDPKSSYYNSNKIKDVKKIVLFCALGFRSALATKSLKEMGFENVANANGGFESLKKIGLPVIAKEKK